MRLKNLAFLIFDGKKNRKNRDETVACCLLPVACCLPLPKDFLLQALLIEVIFADFFVIHPVIHRISSEGLQIPDFFEDVVGESGVSPSWEWGSGRVGEWGQKKPSPNYSSNPQLLA